MAKGASKGNGRPSGGGGAVTPASTNGSFFSKSNVDEYTKDYTPEMFTGANFQNGYIDSLNYLKTSIEDNAPKTLSIDGVEFQRLGGVYTTFEQTGRKSGRNVAVVDYQATRQATNSAGETEYPVLQVGIRAWRTPGGKVKSELIRDGYTNKTRFW